MRGFDTKDHVLTAFGGAGPQHACGVARKLGIEKVLVPRYGGVLSAYGLSLSDAMVEETGPEKIVAKKGGEVNVNGERFRKLEERAKEKLRKEGYKEEDIQTEKFLNLRYEGTDTAIFTKSKEDGKGFWEDYGAR